MWIFAADVVRPTPAQAQETRADEIAAKQKEKAGRLAPYEPSRFERVMTRLEENLASPPNGFYPTIGSVYSGGGFTAGLGYRRFYQRNAVWDIVGLDSIENYKSIQVGTRAPWDGQGKLVLSTRAGWLDAVAIGYYGTGMDLSQPRASFRMSQAYGAVTAAMRPNGWTRFQGELAYEDYQTDQGRGGYPSIETIYTPETAPGLFAEPAYIRAEATAAIDWRTSPNYARKGGSYGVTLASYSDRRETYSFQVLNGELIQHLPVLRENWVISVRGRVETTLGDDDEVPYFLLPRLGSGRTLRGYSTGRFRDRHSLLTSAELRWVPSRLALDMAFFYDAGKVTSRREDLDFRDLASDWGIGARFHTPSATVLRLEGARGSDGWRLVISTSAAF
jgi:hypothetical protein